MVRGGPACARSCSIAISLGDKLFAETLNTNTRVASRRVCAHTHGGKPAASPASCGMCEEARPAGGSPGRLGLGLPPQTPRERRAGNRPRSGFGSPPGFTLRRFSLHFKGSIFVQPGEE